MIDVKNKKRSIGTNVDRDKIKTALNNRKYSMRSLHGIAKEIDMPLEKLAELIKNDNELAKDIKIMPFRSKDGRLLIMSKDRFIKEASLKVKFIDFFATKRQG
ncbi:hypothetical protein MRBLME3_002008 [Enterobacter ludwigii]|uniref:hypothetical protein n=1 Tax=Enterobacter ludwigii TaxID=299767 RepID=UPI00342FF820